MAFRVLCGAAACVFGGVASAGLLSGGLFAKDSCPAPCPAPACEPAPVCEVAPACGSACGTTVSATDYGLPAGATVISVTPAGSSVAPAAEAVPTPEAEPETVEKATKETAEPAPAPPSYAAGGDIVDTAVAAGSFSTLAAALEAAGLVDTLKGEGPFTVFAPTDDAFAAMPEGTLDELLKPESKEKLTSILLYHVVPGKVPAADVVNLTAARTAGGKKVSIAVDGDTVTVDGATVVKADVEATNGVIHVIDAVLLPGE